MAKTSTKTIEQQYKDLKVKHPDAMLLFRCGDFYETYHDDAVAASEVLGITLTKDKSGRQMAGFPAHALDTYLPKLIRAGKRVAICDQLEEPKAKAVERGIADAKAQEDKTLFDTPQTAENDIAKEEKTEVVPDTEVDLDEELKIICDQCVQLHDSMEKLINRLHDQYMAKHEAMLQSPYDRSSVREMSKAAQDVAWLSELYSHVAAIDTDLTHYYIG